MLYSFRNPTPYAYGGKKRMEGIEGGGMESPGEV
jgi:hypothetical protein